QLTAGSRERRQSTPTQVDGGISCGRPPTRIHARDERDNPERSADPAKTPAALLTPSTAAPITIAIGNNVPGPTANSTTIMAATAPARRFPAVIIESRHAGVLMPATRPMIRSEPAVNATARPELRNHGAYSPWNHVVQAADSTICAARKAIAPKSALFHLIMSAPALLDLRGRQRAAPRRRAACRCSHRPGST